MVFGLYHKPMIQDAFKIQFYSAMEGQTPGPVSKYTSMQTCQLPSIYIDFAQLLENFHH